MAALSGGYDPAWAGTASHAGVQSSVLRFQLAQEELFSSLVREGDRAGAPCVLLLDRGALDGRVFCSDEEWAAVLLATGCSDEELLARYDMVVHMRTAALLGGDHYEWGAGSNNEARMHSPAEARGCDERCALVYARHAQHVIVDNTPAFSDKIGAVLSAVTRALERHSADGVAADLGGAARTKSRVGAEVLGRMPLAERAGARVFDFTVTFLDGRGGPNVRRGREVTDAPAVQRWCDGASCEWVGGGGGGGGGEPLTRTLTLSAAHGGANDRYEQRLAAPGDEPHEASARSVISRAEYELAIEAAQRRRGGGGTVAEAAEAGEAPAVEAAGHSMLLDAATAAGSSPHTLPVVCKRAVAFTVAGGHHCELVHYFVPGRAASSYPGEVSYDRPQSMREHPDWLLAALQTTHEGGGADDEQSLCSSEDDIFGAGGASFTQEAASFSPKRPKLDDASQSSCGTPPH